uniref:Ycf35 n=1 Tax=Haramonas pauciplastida TaxID=478668 RepID=UPI002114286C|nr:Ycf35 [Haramonas pauciplastida]YP_010444167.1 Ycf35 [Haramonas pauciplastida]UTE95045.1 Ycf35 [Haramonas pauciplastida]UTE95053.1 Ycf35 [Haramonas pauciplastida]
MSHISTTATSFQSLSTLKKTLNELGIIFYEEQNYSISDYGNKNNLIIKQKNKGDFMFRWTGLYYELMADITTLSVSNFLDKVSYLYALKYISHKTTANAFRTVENRYDANTGVSHIVVEKWKTKIGGGK